MIPKMIDSSICDGLSIWIASTNRAGISLLTSPLDAESTDLDSLNHQLTNLFRELPESINIKFHLISDITNEESISHYRRDSVETIGRTHLRLLIHVETKIKTIKLDQQIDLHLKELFSGLQIVHKLSNLGLELVNLNTQELKSFTHDPNLPISYSKFGIEIGTDVIGVLKLIRLSRSEVNQMTLATLKDLLPSGFEIITSIRRVPQTLAQMRFNQMAKREGSGYSRVAAQKADESERAVENIELDGTCYLSFEMHVIFRRKDEKLLKEALSQSRSILSRLGDFTIETVGSVPSYLSILPGGPAHFAGTFEANVERDTYMSTYCPILTRGASAEMDISSTAFAFHRLDFTRDFFDLFDRRYRNYCLTVVGQGGSGKSVFLNRLIACGAFDPCARIIVVDVKGSHGRLVNALGGETHTINLKDSSGINPFSFLVKDRSEYTLGIVKTFISELMLDDDERRLSAEEVFDLEEALQDFALNLPNDPGIESFVASLPANFPRIKLIKRFQTGIAKKIFSNSKMGSIAPSRIHYYNFQNIDLASNVSMARAIMAAIMADFNFQLGVKKPNEKIIFISDETPFFIEQCFRSFSLLNKNVRALHGSLVLTVQVSNDLIVDGDQSLIDNSGSKILMSIDSTTEDFQKRFRLSDTEIETLSEVGGEKGKYSQFLLKDAIGSRVGNLFLTSFEFWQSTTEAYDMSKIEKLSKQFPTLNDEEISYLMSVQSIQSEASL